MPPIQIKIELTESAKKIAAGLPTLPEQMVRAIARGMDQANQLTIAAIQRDHLTGQGPFPPAEHKLGVRTSRLRGSVNATAATVSGSSVTSIIGSNVIYAAIHEFGGRVHHPARQVKTRLRTDARGNLLRQLGHSKLAIFAAKSHQHAREVVRRGKAYDVDMPERAPFRTGIQEAMPNYTNRISAAIVAEWDKMQN
jgi:phage gpG-like protein